MVAAICGATLLLELVVIQVILPATHMAQSRTPVDVLFNGVDQGMVSSLIAVGVVLIYRSLRIINFAQGAIGVCGAILTFDLIEMTRVPFLIAFPLGLAVSAGFGYAFDLVAGRRFARAPRLALTVFTIAAASFIASVGRSAVDDLPIFPPQADRTLDQISGSIDLKPMLPFPGWHFTLPGSDLPSGFANLLAVVAPVILLVGLGCFLRFTRLGTAVRAMAENSERAALLGISVSMLSAVVWSLAGLLSGASATLTGFLYAPAAGAGATALLLPALAAAVVAGMRNITVAVVASVGISVFTASTQFSAPNLANLTNALLLAMIVVGLLAQMRRRGRSEAGSTTSWAATEEIRPVPRELRRLPSLRLLRGGLIVVALAGVGIYPFTSSSGNIFLAQVVALNAIVALSLVVLTGWTGQVSLGQFGLAAIGAVLAGGLAPHVGFWLAVPTATALTAAVAVLLGIPALRIPGLFLAVATFGFAAAVHDVLFDSTYFGWLLPTAEVTRPTLPFIDFDDERSMYFLCFGALVGCLAIAANLRRSRTGRTLIGVRDNEANAQSAGLSVLRVKLTGFALAGALAGFGGALLAFQQRSVTAQLFTAQASSDLFVTSVIGGVSSLVGPLLGTATITGISNATGGFPEVQAALAPTIAVMLLYVAPGGIASVLARGRDAILRIVAQRSGIVVPSLYRDIDATALHLRLIPMGPATATGGSAAITRDYELPGSRRRDRRSLEGAKV